MFLSDLDKEFMSGCSVQTGVELLVEREEIFSNDNSRADAIAELISIRRPDIALGIGTTLFTSLCEGLFLTETNKGGPGHVEIVFLNGGYRLNFHNSFSFRMLLLRRLIHYIPYIVKAAPLIACSKRVLLELDDAPEGELRQLVSSGCAENHVLVPDSMFLETNAYHSAKCGSLYASFPWTARSLELYWRGSLTGSCSNWSSLFRLPRVRLVLESLSHRDFDVRLIRQGLGQYAGYEPYLSETFEALSLLTDVEPVQRNLEYKYVIDVDGNTNSWPGLFYKMLFGNAILKLRSPYSQWYYPRLRDGEHLIYFENIERDLLAKLSTLRASEDFAHSLGENARTLACSMSSDSEFPFFLEGIEKANLLEGGR